MHCKDYQSTRLIAFRSSEKDLFDVYIDFSGRYKYLLSHRWNERLFSILKPGISINDLIRNTPKVVSDTSLSGRWYKKGGINPRLKCQKNQARKLENSIKHLVTVANEFIDELYGVA